MPPEVTCGAGVAGISYRAPSRRAYAALGIDWYVTVLDFDE